MLVCIHERIHGLSAYDRNEYQEVKAADNLTGLVCRLSEKTGFVLACHPKDLYKGYIYLYL